jgi:hypothetical protein
MQNTRDLKAVFSSMEHYWTSRSALEHNAQVYTCARDLQEDLGVLLACLPQQNV